MAEASERALVCHPMSVPIGYGASGLGNLYKVISDADAEATLKAASDAGYRYFDTSPFYGFGLSELRVGRFLRNLPRDHFLLSTKVGRYIAPLRGAPFDRKHWAGPLELNPVFDYSYDGVMRSIEQSIVRLGFECIDILLIHDVDRWTHGKEFPRMFATAMEGAYRALDELRRNGHVKAIGAGVNESEVAADFLRAGDFDCILLAGRYTLLDQRALNELLPLAQARGVDVLIAGVFNSGVLAAPALRGVTYDYAAAPSDILARARRIAEICGEFGVPLPAAAIQFSRGHPAVKTVVLGMNSPEEVRRNFEWFSMAIPPALWGRLKQEGLIRKDAPLQG
jgi:D-threo-aldose 1-dehydrogenase